MSQKAAQELNLLEGTPVGTSIIDAHAGGLGMLGCSGENISSDFTSRLGDSRDYFFKTIIKIQFFHLKLIKFFY